jgi:hypothetical protein
MPKRERFLPTPILPRQVVLLALKPGLRGRPNNKQHNWRRHHHHHHYHHCSFDFGGDKSREPALNVATVAFPSVLYVLVNFQRKLLRAFTSGSQRGPFRWGNGASEPLQPNKPAQGRQETMNALNLLSARLIGPSTSNAPPQLPPAPPGELVKTRYWFWIQRTRKRPAHLRGEKDGSRSAGADAPEGQDEKRSTDTESDWRADEGETATGGGAGRAISQQRLGAGPGPGSEPEGMPGERAPRTTAGTRWTSWPVTAAQAIFASIRWIISTLAAPSFILIRYISDDRAKYSPLLPVRGAYRFMVRLWRRRAITAQTNGVLAVVGRENAKGNGDTLPDSQAHAMQMESLHGPRTAHSSTAAAPLSGIDEQELETARAEGSGELTRPPLFRTISSSSSDESSSTGQRIRIKTSKEDAQKRRRSRKTDSTGSRLSPHGGERAGGLEGAPSLTPASLKSPISPASSLGMSRYPRAPAPPRPLIPRRRSSNVLVNFPPSEANLKTLILDLDETLIHSLAKGGRMTTGHMVEVKLNPSVGTGGGLVSAPQHPILYYVHKRPHCDEFLRKAGLSL